jgi:hypothetical protein
MAKTPKSPDLKTQIEEATSDKSQLTRVWDLCSLFLRGKQHVRWDRGANNFTRTRNRSGSTVTINLILNIYRNLQSKLALAYPSITVLPASPSSEDIVKSQAAETALKYYWSRDKVKRTLSDALGWVLLTGNCGLYTRFTGKEVTTDVVSPYDLLFEPGATGFDQSAWVAIRQLKDRSSLEEAYPEHKDFIKEQSVADPRASLQGYLSMNEQRVLKDRLETYEVYFRNGDRVVLLGTRYIFKGKWPGDAFPVQFIRHTQVPGKLWGMGSVEPLIEIQTNYNRAREQVIENADLIANPKWMIPKTAGLASGALGSKAGEKVFYNAAGGPPPKPVSMPSLPGYVLSNVQQLASEMLDVAGVHATTLGKRAVGVHSGKAIESLSGKDMTQLQATQSNIEEAVEDMATVVLTLMKKYYTEPRMMKMLDNMGQVVFQQLQDTDLVETPEVFLEAGSLFRDEKQDRDQKVMDLLEMKLIDPATALKELSFHTGNSFVSKETQSIAHARELLAASIEGDFIEIFPTDDLKTFEKVFSDFIRTANYYELPDDRQDYIRDILVSIQTHGQPDMDARSEMLTKTVFPRLERAEEDAQKTVMSMDSPVAGAQVAAAADEFSALKMNRQLLDGAADPEQGLHRTLMGGGG